MNRFPQIEATTLSPLDAALRGYLAMSDARSPDSLSPRLRGQSALAVSAIHGCECCLGAHAFDVERGQLNDFAVRPAQDAGLGDKEIIANVALVTFPGHMNGIAGTAIDFSAVPPAVFHDRFGIAA